MSCHFRWRVFMLAANGFPDLIFTDMANYKFKNMDKQLFIEAIEALQKQLQLDSEVSKHLGKAFPCAFEANLLPRNHFLLNALIHVLQVEMNDLQLCEYGQSWIEYFLWELNFGEENYRLKVTQNGKEIKMSNAAELYDFLNNS